MKKILLIILSTLIIPVSAQASYKYYGCDKKIYQLEKQLKYAKMHGNRNRVMGLERAISNVQNNCYDHYSGATGPTKLNHRYSFTETDHLEQQIEALQDEIERLKAAKN
ncbi:DUF1090 family protein [Providencia rettgeri]|uniref:DUF1090 family protein n=1 Tax=Providencia rettgeri TaxID=587 RepID=UPI00029BC3C0|nr:DUF1090 family protein [Providencia rettgeri]EKT54963.1 hypothetical protein OOC_15539 [Providencia rettgeri Dmel1]